MIIVMAENKKNRKRVAITIEQKLEAIGRLEHGELLKNVAADLNVGKTTVSDWRKSKEELLKFAMTATNSVAIRKTMRRFKTEELNEAVFLWYVQEKDKGVSLSGPLIQDKAKEIALHRDPSTKFTASSGWLDRWKSRYGVKQLNICAGKFSTEFLYNAENCQRERQEWDTSAASTKQSSTISNEAENSCSNTSDDNSNELHDFTTEEVIIKKEDNFSDNEYADNPSYSGEMAEDPMMMHHSAIRHEELPLEICNIKCEPEFGDDLDVSLPKSDTKKRKLDKPEESTEDEFECFGSNVAAQLRSLPLHIALQTQLKLMAVLVEARLTAQQGQ